MFICTKKGKIFDKWIHKNTYGSWKFDMEKQDQSGSEFTKLFCPCREQLLPLRKSRRLSVSWGAAADCLWATWGPENSASLLCLALAFPWEWLHRGESCCRRLCVRATACNSLAELCPCTCWTSCLRASAVQGRGPDLVLWAWGCKPKIDNTI